MPGVVFLIVIPTANFERELAYGSNCEVVPTIQSHQIATSATKLAGGLGSGYTVNTNLPESNSNTVLRLEVELRDKNAPRQRRAVGRGDGGGYAAIRGRIPPKPQQQQRQQQAILTSTLDQRTAAMVPLEKVLEELLAKLEIEHVSWTTSKKGYVHHVLFPLQSGEPCETTLHCLTELGIGTKFNSSVSVLPCSVSYDALTDPANKDDLSEALDGSEDLSKWNTFVESIKSKLTVKQVVDGVRAGGSLSFDYLLLIVTADSLAALGLVENNAPNIVAAMLVSPLMGPVMSITFGTIISDRELMRVGFISLALGMFISCLFGFIFGLILGTTEMPWGSGDWPTEEMRGRGNVRSLWMGVLWALTSGTGVAVALLQGSAGPLIGVAISASLLPPVVNCGLFWALACIWLIYPGIRMPHLKGEAHTGNSSYPFLYTDYLPTEFLINGIVSCLLTVVNVICIFITAIIVLKIKEVSAPYTASPDLKRFWETDLRTARQTNRSTTRRRKDATFNEILLTGYQGLQEPRNHELDSVLEQALKEAEDDVTFRKVKRMSYSSNAAGELTQRLAKMAGLNKPTDVGGTGPINSGSRSGSRMNSVRGSKLNIDLKALDQLVTNLLDQHTTLRTGEGGPSASGGGSGGSGGGSGGGDNSNRKSSFKLSRWRPTSRSAHSLDVSQESGNYGQEHGGDLQPTVHMPTIMESSMAGNSTKDTNKNNNNGDNNDGKNNSKMASTAARRTTTGQRSSWSNSLDRRAAALRHAMRANGRSEESLTLTQNQIP